MPSTKRGNADNGDKYALDDRHPVDDGEPCVDDDYDEEAHQNDRRSKKKKKKVPIMSQSGQTEADRRVLRRRQRELHHDIVVGGGAVNGGESTEGSMGGIEDPISEEFERMREKNNMLWEQVRYTREAVLDSENMDLITAKAARQVERIVQVREIMIGQWLFGRDCSFL